MWFVFEGVGRPVFVEVEVEVDVEADVCGVGRLGPNTYSPT
jgi:hypothetical protein